MAFDPLAYLQGTEGGTAVAAPPEHPAQQPAYALPFDENDFNAKRGRLQEYDEFIDLFAKTHGSDLPDLPNLARAVIMRESGGRANATSSAGAGGLMQIMPETYMSLGGVRPEDRYNPVESVDKGIAYLAQQLRKFRDPRLALAAYNAGPGAVQKYGDVPPFAETQAYVPAVLGYYQALGRGGAPSAVPSPAPAAAPPPFDPMAYLQETGPAEQPQQAPPQQAPAQPIPIPGIPGIGGEQIAAPQAPGPDDLPPIVAERFAANRAESAARQEQIAADAQRGRQFLEEKRGRIAQNPMQIFTPEESGARAAAGGEDTRSLIGRTAGDVVGTVQSAMQYATAPFRGGYDAAQGRRAREAEENVRQKQEVAQLEQKRERGEALTPEEQATLEADSFIGQAGAVAQAMAQHPDEFVKELGLAIIEDGPLNVIAARGMGVVIQAAKAAKGAREAGALARMAKKVQARPELVARAQRMGETRQAVKATEEALTRGSAGRYIGEEVAEDLAGAAAVSVPQAEAQGRTYGAVDALADVAFGAGLGAPTGLLRAAADTRMTKSDFGRVKDVALVAGMENHPAVQELLPRFRALAESPEMRGIRFETRSGETGTKFWSREELDAAGYRDRQPGNYSAAGETGKDGRVILRQSAGPETQVEEAAHFLQDRLRAASRAEGKSGPYKALREQIEAWEAAVRDQARRQAVDLPEGDELFAQVFTSHMGYADRFPSSVNRVVLPGPILEGFRKLMGEDPVLQGRARPEGGDIDGRLDPDSAPPEAIRQALRQGGETRREWLQRLFPEYAPDGHLSLPDRRSDPMGWNIAAELRGAREGTFQPVDPELGDIRRQMATRARLAQARPQEPSADVLSKSYEELEAAGQAPFQLKKQTETPEFRNWFKGSKVTDESGKPIVVYHGSSEGGITQFTPGKDGGMHFGTNAQAKMRNAKELYPVYLKIENPKRLRDTGSWDPKKLRRLQTEGHDGVVYLNRFEGIDTEKWNRMVDEGWTSEKLDRLSDREFKKLFPNMEDSYIVFDPAQIKSASSNRGTFDPNDPDIRHQLKEETDTRFREMMDANRPRERQRYREAEPPRPEEPAVGQEPQRMRISYGADQGRPDNPDFIPERGRDLPPQERIARRTKAQVYAMNRGLYEAEPGMRPKDFDAYVDKEGKPRYQLAEAAGIPEGQADDPKILAAAAKAWREKGTHSPWFQRWFKDSEVVDEKGKPLIVYHGTVSRNGDFDTFKYGGFFTEDPARASEYAKDIDNEGKDVYRGAVFPVYLSIKNGASGSEVGVNTSPYHIEWLKRMGYDGYILNGRGGRRVFIPFYPEQVKSATGNRGTFDEGSADIRHQLKPVDPEREVPITRISGQEIEGATPAEMRRAALRLAKERGILGGTFRNEDAAIDVKVTGKSLSHAFGHPGPAVIRAVAGIPELIRHAVLSDTSPHEPVTPDVRAVHTLFAPLEIGGALHRVKLTVKELTNPEQGGKLYDLQALEIEGGKRDPGGIHSAPLSKGKLGVGPAPGSMIKVRDFMGDVKGRYQLQPNPDAAEPQRGLRQPPNPEEVQATLRVIQGQEQRTTAAGGGRRRGPGGGEEPPATGDEPTGRPRVEEREENLRRAERSAGTPPARLDRETKRTWASLDPEVQAMIREKDDDYFYSAMKRRALDDVEVQAWDAITRGKRERAEELRLKEQELKAEKSEAYFQARQDFLAAQLDYIAAERANLNDGTAAARALAARRRVMAGAPPADDAALVRKLSKEIPGLTNQDIGALVKVWREDPARFPEALGRAIKHPTSAKVLEYWKAGLLSGFSTHSANIIGNALENGIRLAETAIAAGIDQAAGGRRTRFIEEVGAEASGAAQAVPGALAALGRNAMDALRLKDKPVDMGSKFDQQVGAIGGTAGKVIRLPFRFLEIEDAFFKDVIGPAELRKLAVRQAKRDGLSGAALYSRVAAIEKGVDAEPERFTEIIRTVEAAKLSRTFQSDPGALAKWLMLGTRRFPALQVLAPFIKTPANIVRVTLERSPYGFAKAKRAVDAYRDAQKAGAKPAELDRLRGEAVDLTARATLGTAILTGVVGMARMGMLTGGGSTDRQEQNLQRETGWQPYSVVVTVDGQRYFVPFSRFEPLSSLLGIAADVAEIQDEKKAGDMASKVLGSIMQNLVDKTYLRGLTEFGEFVSNPTMAAGQYLTGLAGGILPNIVARAAMAADPTLRDTSPAETGLAGIPEKVGKKLQARVPGASRRLPPRYGGTGEVIERPGSALGRFAGPVQVSEEKPSRDVERELLEIGFFPSAPDRDMTVPGSDGQKVRLSEAQYGQLIEARRRATDRVRKMMQSQGWKRMDAEARRDMAERLFQRETSLARKRIVPQLQRRLQP